MRLAATTVALALALLQGACTVTTEGAPCESDSNCPSDQGCGSDRTCSAAALACPGHVPSGECVPGISCDGAGDVVTCTAGAGVCAGRQVTPCPAHQSCRPESNPPACACDATRCSATVASYCDLSGALVTCGQDQAGCWFASTPAPCAPAQACVETGGSASCQCPAAGPAVGQGCSTQGAGSCLGTQALRCEPAASLSPCLVWTLVADCGPQGLACSASGCQCPAPDGVHLLADAVSGSRATAVPPPTGAGAPARCRFATLGDALAASAAGAGSVVVATGWSSTLPGGVMTFAETGALLLPAGVTLTTDEDPLAPAHYVVVAPATPSASAFVSLSAGATLSGWVIQNDLSTSHAVATGCGTSSATATVTRIAIAGTGSVPSGGTAPARFLTGVRHGGGCSLHLEGSTISGTGDSGLVIESASPASSATIRDNVITGNDASTPFLIQGVNRRGGGVVLQGTQPGTPPATFVFRGNRILGNRWDQVLVYTSSAVSLVGGSDATACGTTSNLIACYDAAAGGVGISSVAPSVDVSYDQWTVLPPLAGADYVGTLSGTNLTCPAATVTCPP